MGYWLDLGQVLLCVLCSWTSSSDICTEVKSRAMNTKKRMKPVSNHLMTAQAWSVKDLLGGKRTLFSCGTCG